MLDAGVGDLDVLGVVEVDDEVEGVLDLGAKSKEASIDTLRFLPRNLISFTGAYFTPVGTTQYAFFCVTVIESLMRTPLSIAKRSDAI